MQERRYSNILLLIASELEGWSPGYAGTSHLVTPQLDALAKAGIRFTNCSGGPVSPLIQPILTNPIQVSQGRELAELEQVLSYPQQLAAAGYICGHGGRRLPGVGRPHPGFVHWYAGADDELPYHQARMMRYGQVAVEPAYLTEAITDDALSFIDWQDGQHPFFLELWYTAPYGAQQSEHPKAWMTHYRKQPINQRSKRHRKYGHSPEIEAQEAVIRYGAAVSSLDEQIGRLMSKLRQKGMYEETLVVFTSDVFLTPDEEASDVSVSETDLPCGVPLILSFPGEIPSNHVVDDPIRGQDVMPMILAYMLGEQIGGPLAGDRVNLANLLDRG